MCACFLFGIVLKNTYSKYNQSFQTAVISNIARPLINIKLEKEKIIENLNLDKHFYEFSVQNFDGESSTEAQFLYNIEFKLSQKNAPIILNLYNENEKISLKNNKTEFPEILDLERKENKYKMEIYYDLNSDVTLEKDFNIVINVQAIQKEGNK